jgi:uncharacterized protein (TIGR00369 family)
VRERIVTWSDPADAIAAARGLTGREVLEAMAARRIPPPPVAQLLGMEFITIGDGHVEMALESAEYLYNTIGSVHGGVLATVLDSVMGCAVATKLDAGTRYTTLDLHIRFVRAPTIESGRLRAIGHVLHLGSRTATTEGNVMDAAGRLCAHGTGACLLFPRTDGRVSGSA